MQVRRRISVETAAPGRLFSALFAGIFALDQIVKAAIRAWMHPGDSIPLIQDVLHITYVRNIGAAFGLMPGNRTLFVSTGVIVTVGVILYLVRTRTHAAWLVCALALVAAGAVGNLVDRIVFERVTDFIDVFGPHFPVFNIADSGIVVGTAMLIVWVLFGPEPDDLDDPDEGIEPEAPLDAPGAEQ